jgi:hypothetical protein
MLLLPDYLEDKKRAILHKHTVDVNGCWIWSGYCNPRTGRAIMNIGNFPRYAARVSYLAFTLQPIGDLKVCHSCDNVACVNPQHLWLGTQKENCADRSNKGRTVSPPGEKNGRSKLTNDKVRLIRSLRKSGLSQAQVAARFGIAPSLVHAIAHRQIWKHVK